MAPPLPDAYAGALRSLAKVQADAYGRWPLVTLMGPTATGKTELALALAEHLPVEIINVDSTQVYRGLDIGTAKPSPALRARWPHHLVDIRDPASPYSVAAFRRDALAAIAAARAAERLPLLVGGTMLYFRALEYGLAAMPRADPAVRAAISAEAAQFGWPALHARLQSVDPQAAAGMHPNNPQRIQRALEVYRVSGRPISWWWQQAAEERALADFHVLRLALLPASRARLRERVAERFDSMLAAGLVEEVQTLRVRGDLDASLPAVRAVGYRQVWAYLEGEFDYPAMRAQAIGATWRLAKRQLTWLRRWPWLERLEIAPGERGEPLRDALKTLEARAMISVR